MFPLHSWPSPRVWLVGGMGEIFTYSKILMKSAPHAILYSTEKPIILSVLLRENRLKQKQKHTQKKEPHSSRKDI